MHVRRRFHAAFKAGHRGASVPIELIAGIYKIEREAKGLSPAKRLALRKEKSIPLLDDFDAWVDDTVVTLLPASPVCRAAKYAKQQRDYIRLCFSDGRFEIDNGRVEREIREVAIGRKNYLFSGSSDGAKRLAHAYTVVLSARKCGLPVREYLIDVLGKLQSGWSLRQLTQLMPQNWAQSAQT